jgi:hypothetical protein
MKTEKIQKKEREKENRSTFGDEKERQALS